jgi:hypothetical protein
VEIQEIRLPGAKNSVARCSWLRQGELEEIDLLLFLHLLPAEIRSPVAKSDRDAAGPTTADSQLAAGLLEAAGGCWRVRSE